MKLLVVEDNPKILSFLSRGLVEEGFSLETCGDGDAAFLMARGGAYDVIVLDVLLPGMDGFRMTSELRRRNIRTPILLLTALGQVDDKVKGLEAGADDYLSKPFAFAELVARIRALYRRTVSGTDSGLLFYHDIVMDDATHSVTNGGRPVELTAREYSILKLFLQNPERLITRTGLLEQVWDMNFDPGTNILDVHISHLRRKLELGSGKRLLQTVHGFGFILKAEPRDEQ